MTYTLLVPPPRTLPHFVVFIFLGTHLCPVSLVISHNFAIVWLAFIYDLYFFGGHQVRLSCYELEGSVGVCFSFSCFPNTLCL